MIQWEYCRIGVHSYSTSLTFYSSDGKHKVVQLYNESNKKATKGCKDSGQVMAELGLEGWEMVGCAATMGSMDYLFKRELRATTTDQQG